MLRDFNIVQSLYSEISSKSAVEINSDIDEFIQQLNTLFITDKGEVLNMPDYGCNLSDYLFKTNYNEDMIISDIDNQIKTYVYTSENISYDLSVEFLTWEREVCMCVNVRVFSSLSNEDVSVKYYA